MEKLFENEDFMLSSTGHDYDFVGIIETKTEEPLTFFFEEKLCGKNREDGDWCDDDIDEDETCLMDVCKGLKPYDETDSDGMDEEQDMAMMMCADSYFRTRDDKSTGFLSDPRERGQFLALIKAYCPEKLNCLPWVEDGKSIM